LLISLSFPPISLDSKLLDCAFIMHQTQQFPCPTLCPYAFPMPLCQTLCPYAPMHSLILLCSLMHSLSFLIFLTHFCLCKTCADLFLAQLDE
jgi:hypothetical protein